MQVAFIIGSTENIGVEYLSSSLKKAGHYVTTIFDPRLFDDAGWLNIRILAKIFSYKKKTIKQIKEINPRMVCFSVMTDEFGWALGMARSIKKVSDAKIVFGGIHPTSVPEEVLQNEAVDFVCVGEGEEAIVELADALEKKKDSERIKNICYKDSKGKIIKNSLRPLIQDLDSLPFADKEGYYAANKTAGKGYGIVSSRGCYYGCTYCCNSMLRKKYPCQKYVRRRSVDNVITELKKAKKEYSKKYVFFHDEIFTSDEKWLEEFAPRYKKEINLPFFCWVHPNHVTKKTAELLASAGCYATEMGVQTMNKRLREYWLGRNTPDEKIFSAIETLREYKIWTSIDMMVGLPEQSEKDCLDIIDFFLTAKPDAINYYWLRYYPETEIAKNAAKAGILNDEYYNKICNNPESRGFMRGGSTFSLRLSQIELLLFLAHFIPERLVRKIIKKRIFGIFPPIPPFVLHAMLRSIRKPKHDFFREEVFKKYLSLSIKRFF